MSILELDEKNDNESGKGFYDTLKNYANDSANDKLAKQKAVETAEPSKKVK